MSYITAVSYHWPQTSAVDKTNASMEWEASSNVPRGPQHHLEPSRNVCEASPSLWTWPGECLRAQWRERVGGQVLLPPPQTRQTTLGQMALDIAAMFSSVSCSNKLTPEGADAYVTRQMPHCAGHRMITRTSIAIILIVEAQRVTVLKKANEQWV